MIALYDVFQRKCAYCESMVDDAFVDHYRPRENATGGSGTSPDHYWWLAWEWRNLYNACNACSRAKGAGFPVDGPRAPLECPYDELATAERALLLDPCLDDPEHLLVFDESGRVVATDVRAMTTIDLLSLNRTHLVAADGARWCASESDSPALMACCGRVVGSQSRVSPRFWSS
jgi:uncharacterized protein (TIGR02646 family)